jgi:hypothetical protein
MGGTALDVDGACDWCAKPGWVMAVTGRPAVERRPSVALEQHRDALAAADAEGNQPELVVLAFHLA